MKFKTIKKYSIQNKEKPTSAGVLLYKLLLKGLEKADHKTEKVWREKIIVPYIADIFLPKYGIVIEADGGIHDTQIEHDSKRDRYLEGLGLIVVRFNNETIEKYPEQIIEFIKNLISKRQDYQASGKYRFNNIIRTNLRKTARGKAVINGRISEFNKSPNPKLMGG